MCVMCVGFFKFAQRFFKTCLFFYKLNFNLKLPYTQYTHLYSPRVSSLFTLSNCTHICTHTVHTWGSSVHTPPNPDRESWFVNHKPHRRLTIINNGVITMNKFKRTQHRATKKLATTRWTYVPFRTSCNPRNNKYHWINLHPNFWSIREPRVRGARFKHHLAGLTLKYHCRQSALLGRYWIGGSRL